MADWILRCRQASAAKHERQFHIHVEQLDGQASAMGSYPNWRKYGWSAGARRHWRGSSKKTSPAQRGPRFYELDGRSSGPRHIWHRRWNPLWQPRGQSEVGLLGYAQLAARQTFLQ